MMTKNQFMLATACLFTVAMLGGCATNSNVAENSEQATEAVAEATSTDAAAPPEMVETASTEETTTPEATVAEITEPAKNTETVAETQAAANDEAPKVSTTKDGVVIIPLGATKEEVAAATAKPVPTPDIPNIAKELTNHHNTQWHSRSFTYRLYLGGQLNAEYSQEKDALTISADSTEANLDCNYSTKHGGLASVDDNKVSACNTLANELQSYLEQD